MKDCIFCKIAAKEIKSAIVYEDTLMIAFLDIMPANKGHCLVVPKKHYTNLFDMDKVALNGMVQVAGRVAKALSLSCGNGSYNLVMNNGKEAGQIVMHAHLHVIPRFKNDGVDIHWEHRKYGQSEMDEYAQKIRKFI